MKANISGKHMLMASVVSAMGLGSGFGVNMPLSTSSFGELVNPFGSINHTFYGSRKSAGTRQKQRRRMERRMGGKRK